MASTKAAASLTLNLTIALAFGLSLLLLKDPVLLFVFQPSCFMKELKTAFSVVLAQNEQALPVTLGLGL
jgi:hypothetical protein